MREIRKYIERNNNGIFYMEICKRKLKWEVLGLVVIQGDIKINCLKLN